MSARLTQAVAAAAARHRELARRIEQLEQEKASLEARPAEQRVAAPAPTAEPARAGGPPTLRELEARAAAEQDPYRRDELEALLLHLRDYADAAGVLPAQFDGLVAQEFGA